MISSMRGNLEPQISSAIPCDSFLFHVFQKQHDFSQVIFDP